MSTKIEHRIGIPLPAEKVWEVLVDFPRWGRWNAVHPEINGRLGLGAPLDVVERLPGEPPKRLVAVCQDWEPLNQILWRVARGPFASSLRFIEIETLTETACIFANGEVWDGALGSRIGRRARHQRFTAFRDMGEALKAQAEAQQDSR